MKAFHFGRQPQSTDERRVREIEGRRRRMKANKQKTDHITAIRRGWMNKTNVASSGWPISARVEFELELAFNKLERLGEEPAGEMGELRAKRRSKLAARLHLSSPRTATRRYGRLQQWALLATAVCLACGLCVEAEEASREEAKMQDFAKARSQQMFSLREPPIESNGELMRSARDTGGRETTLAPASRPPPSNTIKNVTAQNGQSVLLHCLVEPSGSGGQETGVSWFRGTGELQLLTYESSTIIQDQRFVVRHGLVKDDDWALQIKNLDKATDAGLYQCQTNSDPPQSHYYQLNIVEPQVHILGAPDMAVRVGAPINLTCVISQSPDQLQFIFWYKDDRMINYDLAGQRGKIVMSKLAHKADTIASNLQIFSSKLADSANYTCMPSGARPMSIYVHVLEGSDKRLVMFQNDHDPSAAQQSSSAVSVHAANFWRARPYGLLLVALIFASWYQLVVQTHTVFSLLLLAIIGLFIGRLTGEEPERQTKRPAPELLALRGSLSPTSKALEAERPPESTWSGQVSSPSGQQLDPLIRRANSALNLLRALAANQEAPGATAGERPTTPGELKPPEPKPSPSVSSTGSTGYNSDNSAARRRRCSPPPDDAERRSDQAAALALIMDQVINETGINVHLNAMLSGAQTSPSRPPSAKPAARQVALTATNGPAAAAAAAQESHYSSPGGAICDRRSPSGHYGSQGSPKSVGRSSNPS